MSKCKMTLPVSVYQTNDHAAHAVYDTVLNLGLHETQFTLRPYNRFETAFTEWWLVPSTEWPAYRFGKLIFRRYPRSNNGIMYAGYHIEKGFDAKLTGLPSVHKSEIMRDDWYWHTFISEASAGTLDECARRTVTATGTSLRLLIEVHEFNKIPEPDRPRHEPSASIEFSFSPSSEKWKLVSPANTVLASLNEPGTIQACVEYAHDMEDLAYYWLDLMIATPFGYGTSNSPGLGASKIWEMAMKPWLPWVK